MTCPASGSLCPTRDGSKLGSRTLFDLQPGSIERGSGSGGRFFIQSDGIKVINIDLYRPSEGSRTPDRLPTRWPIEAHTLVKHAILKGYLEAWFPILGGTYQ